jgi:hypothetical protein
LKDSANERAIHERKLTLTFASVGQIARRRLDE